MNKNKIKIGIAGYGKMGKIREESFQSSDEVELVSIYDSEKKAVKEGIHFCNSFEELLKTNIDAVFISTYVNVAADYVLTALKAGKHVFCEKPPSINYDELKPIEDFYVNTDLTLKYGFNHRFHYSVTEAKRIIDEGLMGKPILMRGIYGKAGSIDFNKEWRNYRKYSGGGILMDQGIHMLDLFRYLSNEEFSCIASYMDNLHWDIESEDNAFLILKSNSGIISTLHSSATQWRHKFLLEMVFENGYVNLDGILSSTGSYAPEKLIFAYKAQEDVERAMGKPNENILYFEHDPSWRHELDEFINSIKKGVEIHNGNLNDALEVMKLMDTISANRIIT